MEAYCRENPAAEGLPAAVTGRATVYAWRCKEGKAVVARQVFPPDPQGDLAESWVELSPQ